MKSRLTSAVGIIILITLMAVAFLGLSLSGGFHSIAELGSASLGYSGTSPIATPVASPMPAPSPFLSPLATPPSSPTPGSGPEKSVPELMLEYTQQRFPSKSGSPQVILTRSITFSEYPEFGLGHFNPGGQEPPLELVLVKGDFDTSNYGVGQKVGFSSVNYIVYVYDLQHKSITHITVTEHPEQISALLQLAGEPVPTAEPSPPAP